MIYCVYNLTYEMRSIALFLLCSMIKWSSGQELSHKQYTVKDGLPGATVYHNLQDKNGFLWFATDQGVSRFDGRTFTNFTKEDGLPDNEILRLYLDRHDNIWFISLSGIPSVLYNGHIQRMDSCQGVKQILEDNLTDSIFFVAAPDQSDHNNRQFSGYYQSANTPGNWHFTRRMVAVASPEWFYHFPVLKESSPTGINFYYSAKGTDSGEILIRNRQTQRIYTFPTGLNASGKPFVRQFFWTLSADKNAILFYVKDSLYYSSLQANRALFSLTRLNLPITGYDEISSLYCEDDSTLWLTTRTRGLLRLRNFMRTDMTIASFFPESYCTSILKDREGCYWITTHNDGVYYVPNFRHHYLPGPREIADKDIKCIRSTGGPMLSAGSADGDIVKIRCSDLSTTLYPAWRRQNKNNRILDIWPYPGNRLLVGTDGGAFLISGEDQWQRVGRNMAVKGLYVGAGREIAMATAAGIELIDLRRGSDRLIYPFRTTSLAGIGPRYLWATLIGLCEYAGDSVKDLEQQYHLPGITHHIDIAPDSSVWISTQEGIAILKRGQLHLIKKEQGLLSNTCKHVLLDRNTAWVATDKGISRIDYTWEKDSLHYSLSGITEEDGLNANDVNQTALAGDYIWAATARGICYFPRDYISGSATLPVVNIVRVSTDNGNFPPTDTVRFEGPNSRLLIGLAGISFRSGSKVRYEYRLKGLDSSWIALDNNVLEFPTLPFGQFVFEVRAIDRWNNRSATARTMTLLHPPPFWKSAWFTMLIYLVTTFLIGLFFYFFSRHRQRKKEEQYQLKRKMNDLEMMALRSQMDPHFIFNCLSSIQNYVLKADTKNANGYLHKFSTLIRRILQFSPAASIPLSEEIETLELYLELEKMRLGDRMDYHIHIDNDLRYGNLEIPSMVIQPYVENAIRHGISPLQGKKGLLQIAFRKATGYIECSVEDNGVGINRGRNNNAPASGPLPPWTAPVPPGPGHIPMGTGNTATRIDIFNEIHENKILLQVLDRQASDPMTTGTFVKLSFPVKLN
jgi:ligand-binding sensor domain-containing protein